MHGLSAHVAWWGSFACLALALGATTAAAEPAARSDLARLARRSVFFGHQSVGMNLLDGVAELAREGGPAPRIVEVRAGEAVPPGTLGHAWVGENHAPATKLAAFAKAIDALPPPGVEVALVKLCYVDFTPATDVEALLREYREALAGLKRRHPGTTFVHVTAPVSGVQGGWKGWAKRIAGQAPYGLVENVVRERFNRLLRREYQGKEPLFDLARVEATAPDGRLETVTWKGEVAPALVPAYTDDGGHLNGLGRRQAATALVSLLAALPDAKSRVD